MLSTVAFMWGSSLSQYMGTGNDKDKKFLQTIYVRENIIMIEQKKVSYYTVDIYIQKIVFTVEYPEQVDLLGILWNTTQNG